MPARPTKGTVSVYLELPADLMEWLRDFAERDLRTIKAEFIRAVEMLRETYDRPGATPAGTTQRIGATSADTLQATTLAPVPQAAAQKPTSVLEQMSADAFSRFLERLAKKKPLLSYLAGSRRHGLTAEQIVAENKALQLDAVRLMIETLEKEAAKGENAP